MASGDRGTPPPRSRRQPSGTGRGRSARDRARQRLARRLFHERRLASGFAVLLAEVSYPRPRDEPVLDPFLVVDRSEACRRTEEFVTDLGEDLRGLFDALFGPNRSRAAASCLTWSTPRIPSR